MKFKPIQNDYLLVYNNFTLIFINCYFIMKISIYSKMAYALVLMYCNGKYMRSFYIRLRGPIIIYLWYRGILYLLIFINIANILMIAGWQGFYKKDTFVNFCIGICISTIAGYSVFVFRPLYLFLIYLIGYLIMMTRFLSVINYEFFVIISLFCCFGFHNCLFASIHDINRKAFIIGQYVLFWLLFYRNYLLEIAININIE